MIWGRELKSACEILQEEVPILDSSLPDSERRDQSAFRVDRDPGPEVASSLGFIRGHSSLLLPHEAPDLVHLNDFATEVAHHPVEQLLARGANFKEYARYRVAMAPGQSLDRADAHAFSQRIYDG